MSGATCPRNRFRIGYLAEVLTPLYSQNTRGGHSQQVPYTYLGSFLFSSHSKAQNLWLLHNFILGILGPIAIFLLLLSLPVKERAAEELLLTVLMIFPQMAFSFSLLWLGYTNTDAISYDDDFDPYSQHIRNSLIFMACEAVGYSVLVLLLERYHQSLHSGAVGHLL